MNLLRVAPPRLPLSLWFRCREDAPPNQNRSTPCHRNAEPTKVELEARVHNAGAQRPSAPTRPENRADPLGGKFTLDDALKDLPGKGRWLAEIQTGLGKLECKLYADNAPITVANFVGLARGLRPFKAPAANGRRRRPTTERRFTV